MTESRPEQPTGADPEPDEISDDRDVPTPHGDRPQQDAVDAAVQQENAATSLDQPSQ
ncbi:hypothetical protein [Nocardioides sp. zg-DK7169]|uniref:hypothetical protein n=1 Tax=Nocardioides sp. zg-DK7169 TaxID=2736600 RepID=UPI00155608F9|nr:hypothetical protein [Nocardioides sp. zg-DK7169]NPC97421.1 hypothetical protein [Nocardioides sp. zg-DK7169]